MENLRVIQANVAKSVIAINDLLIESKPNFRSVFVLQEPPKVFNCGFPDSFEIVRSEASMVAIALPKRFPWKIVTKHAERDVCTLCFEVGRKQFTICSIYCPPTNQTIAESLRKADIHSQKLALLCGDFNAHHSAIGGSRQDRKGTELMEFADEHQLCILNDHLQGPTFISPQGSSFIDVTMSTVSTIQHVIGWQLLHDAVPFLWHRPIEINLCFREVFADALPGYRWSECNWNSFGDYLRNRTPLLPKSDEYEDIDQAIMSLQKSIQDAIFATTPKAGPPNPHTLRHNWWSPRLSELKRRRDYYYRLFKMNPYNQAAINGKDNADREFRREIRKAKREDYKNSLEKEGPWRLLRRVKSPTNTLATKFKKTDGTFSKDVETQHEELMKFYCSPSHDESQVCHQPNDYPNVNDVRLVTPSELIRMVKSLKNGKAAGFDCIRAEHLKHLPSNYVAALVQICNICLNRGYFPSPLKVTTVSFLRKPKPVNQEGSVDVKHFRPICVTPIIGKLLEKIISARLDTSSFLLNNQHAYMKGRSCITALHDIVNAIEARQKSKSSLLLSFDFSNAFPTAPPKRIVKRLKDENCPQYLVSIITSLLAPRTAMSKLFPTIKYSPNIGTPQGGVLSPILWNVCIDDAIKKLSTAIPNINVTVYADDINVVINGSKDDLLSQANRVAQTLHLWAETQGLLLNVSKTQATHFASKKNMIKYLNLGEHRISTAPSKVLGVWFDARLKFTHHVEKKLESVRPMADRLKFIGRVTYGTSSVNLRKIYTGAILPKISYATEIWGNALKYKYVQKKLRAVHRTCNIKICKAFKSAGRKEVLALSGTVDIVEHLRHLKDNVRLSENDFLMILRNQHEESKFTFSFEAYSHFPANIPHTLTQALTGHNRLRHFINKVNGENPFCNYHRCSERETVEHITYRCPKYSTIRKPLTDAAKRNAVTFENLDDLIENRDTFYALIDFLNHSPLCF